MGSSRAVPHVIYLLRRVSSHFHHVQLLWSIGKWPRFWARICSSYIAWVSRKSVLLHRLLLKRHLLANRQRMFLQPVLWTQWRALHSSLLGAPARSPWKVPLKVEDLTTLWRQDALVSMAGTIHWSPSIPAAEHKAMTQRGLGARPQGLIYRPL